MQEIFDKYNREIFYLTLVMALVLSRLPYVGKVLGVINTMVHEAGHAIVALILNGEVVKIDLFSDTSGKATTKSPNRFVSILVTMAGYPFASFLAFVSFYFFKQENFPVPLLMFSVFAVICLLFWVRNLYGILWLVLFLSLAVVLFYYGDNNWLKVFSVFFGGVLLAESIISAGIICYLSIMNSKSSGDAISLKDQTYVPAFFWGMLFFGQALYFGYLIMKMFV